MDLSLSGTEHVNSPSTFSPSPLQSEVCSSLTSQDSSIVSADTSIVYQAHVKDRTIKELLKQKMILFDNNETRLQQSGSYGGGILLPKFANMGAKDQFILKLFINILLFCFILFSSIFVLEGKQWSIVDFMIRLTILEFLTFKYLFEIPVILWISNS